MAHTSNTSPELIVIIPVYNEQECIATVLAEWRECLRAMSLSFLILVIDDGSTDETPARLAGVKWPELKVHRHSNRGHGQSCLVGYQMAEGFGASYVLQVDSDGQCDPKWFAELWTCRERAVAVYGRRVRRDDGAARRIVTTVLRWTLKSVWRTQLNDTNVPYRLYRVEEAAAAARRIPASFDLANIAVALLLEPKGFLEIPISFRDRQGGHASVKWWGFARKGRKLLDDLKGLRSA